MSCVEASGTRRYTASTRLSHVDRAVGRPNASRRSGVGKRQGTSVSCPVPTPVLRPIIHRSSRGW